MKVSFVSILFLFIHLSYSQPSNENIIFSKANYKIEYPQNWRLDTSRIMGAEFFIFSPLESQTDKFRENINLLIQDLTGQNIDLVKYKQITERQISEMTVNPKLFESSLIKNKTSDYFKTTYAMTQNNFRLKITSICFIKDEKAYLLTFTSEYDKYDKYEKNCKEILSSFFVQ